MSIFRKLIILFTIFCLTESITAQDAGSYWIDLNLGTIKNLSGITPYPDIIILNDKGQHQMTISGGYLPSQHNTNSLGMSANFQIDNSFGYTSSSVNSYLSFSPSLNLQLSTTYLNKLFNAFNYEISATYKLQPYAFNLFFFNPNGVSNTTNELPSADKITIKATQFDYPEVYKWQYKVDDITGSGTAWVDFPSTYLGKDQISFSGFDFFTPTEFKNMIDQGKYLFIKINYASKMPSTPLMLNPKFSAPHIVLDKSFSPTCHGGADGRVEITFDRKVEDYETVEVAYRPSETIDYFPVLPVNSGSSTFTFSNLDKGEYDVMVSGTYKGGEYNESATHKKAGIRVNDYDILYVPVTNPVPPKCFGGTGSATVSPKGGASGYTIKWGDANTSMTRNDLLANVEYRYTVTDQAGCSKDSTVTLSQPTKLTYSVNSTNPTCFSSNNGSISVTPSGGTPPYRIVWTDNASTEMIRTGLSGISYSFTLYDKNDYCSTGSTVPLIAPANLTFSVNSVNPKCSSSNDGTISITPSGGTPPYRIVWTDGSTEMNRTGLSGISYSFTLYDKNDYCSTGSTVPLIAPANLTFSVNSVNPKCSSSNDGTISITPSGGTPPYRIVWTDGSTEMNRTGLSGISYSFTLYDKNDYCSTGSTVPLTAPANLTFSVNSANPKCSSSNDGTISITPSGGTPPYRIVWTDGSTEMNRTGLSGISYGFTLYDKNDYCSTGSTVPLTAPENLTFSVNSVNPKCSSSNDGTISITPSGGTSPYRIVWTDGSTEMSRTGLSGISYGFTLYDKNDYCSTGSTITLTAPGNLSFSLNSVKPTCSNSNNGSISVTPSGGTPPYRIVWTDGSTEMNRSGLSGSSYSFTLYDNSDYCSISSSVPLTAPENLTFSVNSANPRCSSSNDGTISITPIGGTPPYRIIWTDGSTEMSRTGLSGISYSFTLYDKNDYCSTGSTIPLTAPANLTFNLNSTNPKCSSSNDGTISITPSGGTPPYRIVWTDGSTEMNRTDLSGISYSFTLYDKNDYCSTSSAVPLTAPANLTFSINSTNLTCFNSNNGTISVTPSGGTPPYRIVWTDGSTEMSRTDLSASSYDFTVYDNHSCSTSSYKTLTQPTQITASINSKNLSCFNANDGEVTVTPAGGVPPYSILWTDNNSTDKTRTNLSALTYSFIITDGTGCSRSFDVPLTQPNLLTTTVETKNSSCFQADNGTIIVTPTGGTAPYSISWTDNSTTNFERTGLEAKSYSYTVKDAHQCTSSSTITLTQPNLLTIDSIVSVQATCYGRTDGSAKVKIMGGTRDYKLIWSDASNGRVISSTDSIVTDFNNPIECYSTITNRTGKYKLGVTDVNSCFQTLTVTITQPDSLDLKVEIDPVKCNGGDWIIRAKAKGGVALEKPNPLPYVYEWYEKNSIGDSQKLGSTDSILVCKAGNYFVKIIDKNLNQKLMSFNLEDPSVLSVSLVKTDIQCHGDSIGSVEAIPTGGTAPYSYLWGKGETTKKLEHLKSGNYSVTVTDSHGCSALGNIDINESKALKATLYRSTDISCNGSDNGIITIKGEGGSGSYKLRYKNDNSPVWKYTSENFSPDTIRIEGLKKDKYYLTIQDSYVCNTSDTIVVDIKEPSAIQIDSIAAQQPKAKNGTNGWIKLGIKGGTFISPQTLYKIKWSYTNGDQIPFASNDTLTNNTTLFTTMKSIGAGQYTLSVTDANNCTSSKNIIIGEPDLLEVTVNTLSPISCNGESGTLVAKATGGVRFKGLKKPYIYEWYGNAEKTKILQSGNDSTFKCISNDYFVIVKDSNEIKATSEIINLPQPNKLTATINTTDVSETSENDGSLEAIVTGGTPPYKYLCNKIETTAITDGLKAGIYDVLVTDLNLCSVEVKDIKINKNCGTYFGMNAVNPGCTGGTDGKITIIPIDKTWKYKLVYWSQKDTIKKETKEFTGEITITDLVADNYTLKLIGSGCEPEKYVRLDDPSAINISTIDLKPARKHGAADGAVKVSVSGGTPIADTGYTLNWTDSQGIVASIESLSADKKTLYSTIQNCKAGEYSLLVTDAHNCTRTYKATINQPDSLILNPLNESKKIQINGERASITASAIGGQLPYQFIWHKISQNDTTVVYTDLQDESSTLSLLAGKYYVKVVDYNKNEVSSGTYLIAQPDPISIHFQAKEVDCYGSNTGRIVATVSGGVAPYTVNGQLLSADTFVMEGLASTDYKVTAVDRYSATVSGSTKVGHPNDVKVSLIQKNPICANSNTGEIQILPTGGRGSYKLTYWSDKDKTEKTVSNFKSTTITGLNMDKYYLQVEDSVGCKSTSEPIKTTNLVDPSVVTISFQGTTAATGYGLANGTAKFSIEGGTPYSTPNALYILKWFGEDGNEIETGNIYNSILNGKMYTEIRNVKGGLYSLVVKDANACVGSSPVKISQPNALQVAVKTQSIIHCYDETGKLEATALGGVPLSNTALPYNFSWFKKTSSGVDVDLNWHGGSIDNCKAGDYFVKIKDANGNEASSPLYTLTQPEALSTIFEVSDVYCVGSNSGQIVTKPSGGTAPYKYAWKNTSNTTNKLEKLIVGTYSVTIIDDLGCSITKAATIKQQPSMQVDVKLKHPTCDKGDDGKIEVLPSGGLPPYTIKWSDGQNQTLKTGLKAGVHEFTVTDNSGCWNTYTQTLINPAPVLVNLGSKVTLCQGQALTQNITLPNDAGAQYQWSDAAGVSHRTSNMLLSDPGTYTATITTSKGCIGSSSILVERSDKVLEADFMMASKAALGNSVEIINITYPLPNSASWIIPESSNVTVVENTESKLTLQFSELGEYTIGIKTKEGNCEKMLYKNIKIVDQSEMVDYKEGKEALIKKFIVSPNPTKGDFKVGVEFSEKIDAVLLLIDSDSGKTIERRELSNSDWYEAPFNVSMPAGNYMIHLVCTKAQANFKFLIKSGAY